MSRVARRTVFFLFAFCCSIATRPLAAAAPALPDTPQGRAVKTYLEAFNSGDEKTFVAMHDKVMSPNVTARLTPERRAEMFKRMQGDFGKLEVEKVVTATAKTIKILVPLADGHQGVFTFDFEEKEPFRIVGVGIDVR